MFGSTILEVAIGLALVYTILSLITTTVTNFITQFRNLRARNLRSGVHELLRGFARIQQSLQTQTVRQELEALEDRPDPEDLKALKRTQLQQELATLEKKTEEQILQELVKKFYEHPAIQGILPEGDEKQLEYIPGSLFARVLFDLVIDEDPDNPLIDFERLKGWRDLVAGLGDGMTPIQKRIILLLNQIETLEEGYQAIENWFDAAMENVSRLFSQQARVWAAVVAFLVVLVVNADTLFIFNRLNTDETLREAIVVSADEFSLQTPVELGESADPEASPDLEGTFQRINELQSGLIDSFYILGWVDSNGDARIPATGGDWVSRIIGLVITGIAVSLGAPFWFDVLKNLTSLRRGGEVTTTPSETRDNSRTQPIIITQPSVDTTKEGNPSTSSPPQPTTPKPIPYENPQPSHPDQPPHITPSEPEPRVIWYDDEPAEEPEPYGTPSSTMPASPSNSYDEYDAEEEDDSPRIVG